MTTILERLIAAIRKAAEYNSAVEVAPSCILWTDKEKQFEGAISALQKNMPELLVWGTYDAARRRGPTAWIRCALSGKVKGYDPQGHVPVVYLPDVSRADLRIVQDLKPEIKTIAYLAFRGAFFIQKNSKDWTLLSFMVSKDCGGLGLDVASDTATKMALQTVFPMMLDRNVEEFKGHRLEQIDFNAILAGDDPTRNILRWLNDGDAWRRACKANEWTAFVSVCKAGYAFDPEKDGQGEGLKRFAERKGAWRPVFERYSEGYTSYPKIAKNLEAQTPPVFDFFESVDTAGGWPQWNEQQEAQLAGNIRSISAGPVSQALGGLRALEATHGPRRAFVWAKLKKSPLAEALPHLVQLAETALVSTPQFSSLTEISTWYQNDGWKTDAAARMAVAVAGKGKEGLLAVKGVVDVLYRNWLETLANTFQKLVEKDGYVCSAPVKTCSAGEVCIFADGLRLDVAKELAANLSENGYTCSESYRWAPIPTMTATGKPMSIPGVGSVEITKSTDKYDLLEAAGLTFEKLLKNLGYTKDTGLLGSSPVWIEKGDLDETGHEKKDNMPQYLEDALSGIEHAIADAFNDGAKSVRVVTDHGWLWLPGAFPKTDLPAGLADEKKGRYATIPDGAVTDEIELPWSWKDTCRVSYPRGISCHRLGLAYTHGGLTLQECRLMELVITPGVKKSPVALENVSWTGLWLKCKLVGDFANCQVEVREDPINGASLLNRHGVPNEVGNVKGLVADEELMGKEAFVVVVDQSGVLLVQQRVHIGG